jgi:hypothetical protein
MTDPDIETLMQFVRDNPDYTIEGYGSVYVALLTLRTQRDALAQSLADRLERERLAFVKATGA